MIYYYNRPEVLLDTHCTDCALVLTENHIWSYFHLLTLVLTRTAETRGCRVLYRINVLPGKPRPFWYYGHQPHPWFPFMLESQVVSEIYPTITSNPV